MGSVLGALVAAWYATTSSGYVLLPPLMIALLYAAPLIAFCLIFMMVKSATATLPKDPSHGVPL